MRLRPLLLAALFACSIVPIAGCGTNALSLSTYVPSSLVIPGYEVRAPSGTGRFLAGAASVDFTPPPGIPTGGDGPAGTISRGYLGRLRARAIFLEDAAGHALVLVSADLFAIPGALHDAVAADLARDAGMAGTSLPPEAIILAATHTHQGPGNFLSAPSYNSFGSAYPGFDPRLFARLRRAIVEAVREARRSADAPGRVDMTIATGDFSCGLKNREPRSFILNPDAKGLMQKLGVDAGGCDCEPLPGEGRTEELRAGWDISGCPRLRALDPTITVVDIARDRRPVAQMVFLAAHPTLLPAETPFFSGDFVGYAMHRLEAKDPGKVVAFFNGAEGDVVARRAARDYRDLLETGDALVAAIEHAANAETIALDAAGIETAGSDELARDATCDAIRLAPKPMYGSAAIGGAEDDHTVLAQLGWSDGVRDIARHGHGAKIGPFDPRLVRLPFSPTELAAPPRSFPTRIPISHARIGGFELAAFPSELTTAQGMMVRDALAAGGEDGHRHLALIGLANEYIGYTSTSFEYARQDYMGASTIWGPNQGDYLACKARELKTNPARSRTRHASRWYRPGNLNTEDFGEYLIGERRTHPDDDLENILRDKDGIPVRNLPWFEWDEPRPRHGRWQAAADAMRSRTVEIEECSGGRWRVRKTADGGNDDDRNYGMLVMALGTERDRRPPWKAGGGPQSYAALWLAPLTGDTLATSYRFHVVSRGGDEYSKPFRWGALPYPQNRIQPDSEAGDRSCEERI